MVILDDRVGSVPAQQQGQLTAGCLFSGMGGFASGLAEAGFSIQWANDIDEFACRTFRYRFPGVRVIEKDVQVLSVREDGLSSVDVLVAGFPCQSFSQAGNRRGFKDSRGELFFEIPRLLGEYDSFQRPKLVILENVPHLLKGGALEWFDQIRRSLRKAGYWFREQSCWIVNVKDVTDLPQDRERLFMVAASRKYFPYNPFIFPSNRRNGKPPYTIERYIDRTKKGKESAYLSADNRYYKMIDEKINDGESDKNIYQLRRSYVREKRDGLCPTLTANMGIGGHNVPFIKDEWGIRKLSVTEVAKLQGFNTAKPLFPAIPESEQYRLLGNAVCVHLVEQIGKMSATILRGM